MSMVFISVNLNMAGEHNGVGAKIRAKIAALYPNSSFA